MATALSEAARSRGTVLRDFHGVLLPPEYGDGEREWRAAREGAVVFDAGFRACVVAVGADRVGFLHGMLSNDIKALEAGGGTYAAMLNQTGKVIADTRVYAEADRLVLETFAWCIDDLLAALDRYLVADDVEFVRPTDEIPLIGVEGPFARAVLAEALGVEELPRQPFAHVQVTFQTRTLRVANASELGSDGFIVRGEPGLALPLFDACREAGAVPLGTDALDVLRVEQGVPWPRIDMDENVLVMEVGLERALSFQKGCYLGQEVVERIAARGHVNRRLTGLVVDEDVLPEREAVVRAGDAEAGAVTSAVRSWALGRVVALALIHRKYIEPGTRLEIATGGRVVGATVSALPFET